MMKKGFNEKEEAPLNYDRDKIDDTSGKTEGDDMDQKVIMPTEENKNVEQKQEDYGRTAERRKDKKDSLKAKEKEVEQKDSIEK